MRIVVEGLSQNMIKPTIQWYKRWQMELSPLSEVRPGPLPEGFQLLPWRTELLELHAHAKSGSFAGEIDTQIFPTLGNYVGCLNLLREIVNHPDFCPEATWLLCHGATPAGTVQGLASRKNRCGAIQNLGILPEFRNLGLGAELLKAALRGFFQVGMNRAFLEVTADNERAVKLYRNWGFRCRQTVYKPTPG